MILLRIFLNQEKLGLDSLAQIVTNLFNSIIMTLKLFKNGSTC